MSQADIQSLRAACEAANRGDWNAVLAVMHPDIEWKTTLSGTYRGHKEVRRFFEDQMEPFQEVVLEPFEFFERDNQIVMFVLIRYRLRRTSVVPPEVRVGAVWTMRDGKAVRCETFPRREKALAAAGLSERGAHG